MTMLSHKSDLIAALAIGAVIGHQNGIQKYAECLTPGGSSCR